MPSSMYWLSALVPVAAILYAAVRRWGWRAPLILPRVSPAEWWSHMWKQYRPAILLIGGIIPAFLIVLLLLEPRLPVILGIAGCVTILAWTVQRLVRGTVLGGTVKVSTHVLSALTTLAVIAIVSPLLLDHYSPSWREEVRTLWNEAFPEKVVRAGPPEEPPPPVQQTPVAAQQPPALVAPPPALLAAAPRLPPTLAPRAFPATVTVDLARDTARWVETDIEVEPGLSYPVEGSPPPGSFDFDISPLQKRIRGRLPGEFLARGDVAYLEACRPGKVIYLLRAPPGTTGTWTFTVGKGVPTAQVRPILSYRDQPRYLP